LSYCYFQIIAYTFGLNGVALDAPGANAIISSKKYQAHLALLQQKYPNAFNDVGGTPDTGENFTNIVECDAKHHETNQPYHLVNLHILFICVLVLSTRVPLYIYGSIGGFAVITVGLMISICCCWRHCRQHTGNLFMLCNLRRV
jgi:hypothetical protein